MGGLNLGKCHSCGQKTSTERRSVSDRVGLRTKCCDRWLCVDCICWIKSDESYLICKVCCDCEGDIEEESSASSSSIITTSYSFCGLGPTGEEIIVYDEIDNPYKAATNLYTTVMIIMISIFLSGILYYVFN